MISTRHKRKPRYQWDHKRRVYVDYDTGEVVEPKKVRAWVLALALLSKARLKRLGEQLQAGEISKVYWQAMTAKELKNLHTAAGVMAVGGDQNLTGEYLAKLEEREAFQMERLNVFASEISEVVKERGAGVAARAGMYAMAAVATYANIDRLGMLGRIGELATGGILPTDVEVIERRVTNSHAPCGECSAIEAVEWQPYGTLPELGDQECLANCQCEFEYRIEGSMRDEDIDPEELPYAIADLPIYGNYRIDPSAIPSQPARVGV